MSLTRAANPVWLFTDLTGNILDDTYWMSTLQNVFPYLPSPIYQDSGAVNVWSDPIQFHPDGTLPDNMYWLPGAVYRLEIRQGPLQSDPLIRLIENYIPNANSSSDGSLTIPVDNQITNPQFAVVGFHGVYTITNTGVNSYDIAPGWVLDLNSTAGAVVTLQQIAIPGNADVPTGVSPTNPGYALQVTLASGTFTTANLRQRFSEMPAIWAAEGISINLTGKIDTGLRPISVIYKPSTSSPLYNPVVLSDELSVSYSTVFGAIQLSPASVIGNSDSGLSGYVDLVFVLPTNLGSVTLTNIQAIGSATASLFPYGQTTVERQVDHTFHNYKESILRQPKDNILVGWTFALNPWQFRTTTISNVANNTYTADQTIIIQQHYVDANVGNNIAVGIGTATDNYAFVAQAVTATNKFAMIQYIDPSTAAAYWSEKLSAMVRARLVSPTHSSTVRFKVWLIANANLPPPITRIEPIATWGATTDPTFAANWVAYTALGDPIYTLGDGSEPFNFDGFQELPPGDLGGASTLGIMFFTVDNMNQTATADEVHVDRISLTHNDFAIDANPETYDETLRKCQFYYEKSYIQGVVPGTASVFGQQFYRSTLGTVSPDQFHLFSFELDFQEVKRAIPTVTIYNPASGASNAFYAAVYRNAAGAPLSGGSPHTNPVSLAFSSQYTPSASTYNYIALCKTTTSNQITTNVGTDGDEGAVQFQYTADARLGL